MEHLARVFRGEAAISSLARGWLRRAAEVCGVPQDAVGRLLALALINHAVSHLERHATVQKVGAGAAETSNPSMLRGWAERWLDDPALGPSWRP